VIHVFMANSIWKGRIAFGMVSFPVKLSAATNDILKRETIGGGHGARPKAQAPLDRRHA
jgi:hypothetical protein